MTTVTVYTSGPSCMACVQTKRHLTKRGIEFTEVPIADDSQLLAAFDELDLTTAPVVCADGLRAELDNVLYEFRALGSTVAGITRLMQEYAGERDCAREDLDIARGELETLRERAVRADELEAELAETRGRLQCCEQAMAAAVGDAQ